MTALVHHYAWVEEYIEGLLLGVLRPEDLYAKADEDDGNKPYGQGDVDDSYLLKDNLHPLTCRQNLPGIPHFVKSFVKDVEIQGLTDNSSKWEPLLTFFRDVC